MDKRLVQYLCLKLGYNWRMLQDCLKFPKSEWPEIWIRLPRHTLPKSWEKIEDPVVLLDRNLYGHPLPGLLWEKTIRRSLIRTRMGESPEMGMYVRSSGKKGLCPVKKCGRYQNGWRKAEYGSHVGKDDEHVDIDESTSCSWPCKFGCALSVNANRMKQSLNITRMAKTARTNSSVVLRYGRTC